MDDDELVEVIYMDAFVDGYEAAERDMQSEIDRLREALGSVSRMKVFPDPQINQFTLATAIQIARAALGEGKE